MPSLRVLILTRQYGGCGYYRQRIPARVLEAYPDITVTHFDGELFHRALKPAKPRPPQPDWVTWLEDRIGQFDLVLSDRPTDHETLAYLRGFVQNSPGCRLIIDFDDDFTRVPRGNPAHRFYTPGKECYETGLQSLRLAEATSVSTKHLAEVTAPLTHFVRPLPNMIDPADWEGFPVSPERAADPHLRILYSGAAGHYEDLDEIREPFTDLLSNPPLPLRLIIMGSSPVWLHDLSRKFPGRIVVLPWHPFPDYPPSVAWGGYDLAIAPLTASTFNNSKSDIKILEAGLQNIPIVCSNIGPYRDVPSDCAFKVENTPAAWSEAMTLALTDPDLRTKVARRCNSWVKDCRTSSVLGYLWYDFIQEAHERPRIETLEDTRLPAEVDAAAAVRDQLPAP